MGASIIPLCRFSAKELDMQSLSDCSDGSDEEYEAGSFYKYIFCRKHLFNNIERGCLYIPSSNCLF